tara:strand:- start:1346 stop:1666 length:321 start_codon:yes stop_codon:yes gene_type:complete
MIIKLFFKYYEIKVHQIIFLFIKVMDNKFIIYACIIALIINIVLPKIVKPYATQNEIKPPNGASNLSFKSQLMHMLVHHAQVPISSSLIIVIIVFLSLTLANKFVN